MLTMEHWKGAMVCVVYLFISGPVPLREKSTFYVALGIVFSIQWVWLLHMPFPVSYQVLKEGKSYRGGWRKRMN